MATINQIWSWKSSMLVDPVIKSVASKIVRQFVANAIKGIVSEL